MADMSDVKLQTLQEAVREKTLRRLKAIQGQVEGVQRMVADGRYCIDLLTQLSSIQEATRGVAKLVLRNYLENCATAALRSRKKQEAQAVYDELMEVFYKFGK